MLVIVAIVLAIVSFIAGAAGKKAVSIGFGLLAGLTFIIWLKSGPGFSFLDWMDNPTGPEIPDNIPVPGR